MPKADDGGDLMAALPVDCPITEPQLRERIEQGIPPSTAAEYLARVRLEESDLITNKPKTHPIKTKRAAHPPPSSGLASLLSKIPSPPAGLEPPSLWDAAVVQQFAELRLYVRRWRKRGVDLSVASSQCPLPRRSDAQGWDTFMLGKRTSSPPLLRTCLRFDQVLVNNVLGFQNDALMRKSDSEGEDEGGAGDEIGEGGIEVPRPGMEVERALWIFSLLVCLDKPLLPDTQAVLREILRECAERRSGLSSRDPRLGAINVLAAVIGVYFKQGD